MRALEVEAVLARLQLDQLLERGRTALGHTIEEKRTCRWLGRAEVAGGALRARRSAFRRGVLRGGSSSGTPSIRVFFRRDERHVHRCCC